MSNPAYNEPVAIKPRIMGLTKCLKDINTTQRMALSEEAATTVPSEDSLPTSFTKPTINRSPRFLGSLTATTIKNPNKPLQIAMKELKQLDLSHSSSEGFGADKLRSPLVEDPNSLPGWRTISIRKSKLSPKTYFSGTSVSPKKERSPSHRRKFTFKVNGESSLAPGQLMVQSAVDAGLQSKSPSDIIGSVNSLMASQRIIVSPNKLAIHPVFFH